MCLALNRARLDSLAIRPRPLTDRYVLGHALESPVFSGGIEFATCVKEREEECASDQSKHQVFITRRVEAGASNRKRRSPLFAIHVKGSRGSARVSLFCTLLSHSQPRFEASIKKKKKVNVLANGSFESERHFPLLFSFDVRL